MLIGLLSITALYHAAHLTALADSDVWWHLCTGTWILQNHAIPRQGLFSQFPSLPWVDCNWGFDLLAASAWRLFGLRGLPLLLIALQVAVAAALFLLGGGTRNFWRAAILAAVAQYCFCDLKLRPALISIVFFALELALLLHSRRSGQLRTLLGLPLLFLLWANLDRQFVYGLLVLGLFWAVAVAEYLGQRAGSLGFEKRRNVSSLGMSTAGVAASLLATLASPYTYRVYQLIWESATSTAIDRYLPELHSLRFRQPQDYLLMLLVMVAFLVLGRQRSRDIFQISVLVMAAVISFRFQRDMWLVTVAAVAILGNASFANAPQENSAPVQATARWERPLAAVLVLAVLVVASLHLPARNEALLAKIGKNFPVRASDYIRDNRLPRPLFNTYSWGSFLTWYLPDYPVLMDSRIDLYRDALAIPYFKLTLAEIPMESHPGFAQAQTFLLEAKSPIAEALATLPNFRVAYRDDLAWVLVRRDSLP